jgi:two-component system sensor histidine kinase KdpD
MDSLARPVLVALGSEARSLRLIQIAWRTARELGAPWIAVHVDTGKCVPAEDPDQVKVWLQEAQRLGAVLRRIEAPLVVQGLVEVARETRPQVLVVGRARERWPWARLGHSTAEELRRRGLGCRIIVIDEQDSGDGRGGSDLRFQDTVATFAVLGACSGLAWLLPAEAVGVLALPVYLLGVVVIAHRWGQGLATLATVLSVLLCKLLSESPRLSGATGAWPNLLVFLLLLFGAQFVVGLVHRLRDQAQEVKRRELQTASLYLLGKDLARCQGTEDVGGVAAEHIRRVFQARGWLLVSQAGGWKILPDPLEPGGDAPSADFLSRLDAEGRPGDPLEPVLQGGAYLLALTSTDRREGLLRILPGESAGLPAGTWELLKAFAVQLALSLERLRWLEEARQAQMERETERLRNALLGAIGHDLRTPLAAIHGAASSLLVTGEMPEDARKDLLLMIQEESDRLAQLLTNLLDLTRLEAGTVRVEKAWQPFEEVVGSVVLRTERQGQEVLLDLPLDLPLVPMDGALLQQALLNLMANAGRHAPGHPVELRAWREGGDFQLEVSDRGPGIPESCLEQVFDKFVRLPGAGAGGVGLGLSICRAIVQAHGGRIWAENREGGGTTFRIELPLEGPPMPALEPEWEGAP